MINYKPSLIEALKEATNTKVLSSYPNTKIIPVCILIEDSNEQIRSLDNINDLEHEIVSLTLEIYASNKDNLIKIINDSNDLLTNLGFNRYKTEEIDNGEIFAYKLKYNANIYQQGDRIYIN